MTGSANQNNDNTRSVVAVIGRGTCCSVIRFQLISRKIGKNHAVSWNVDVNVTEKPLYLQGNRFILRFLQEASGFEMERDDSGEPNGFPFIQSFALTQTKMVMISGLEQTLDNMKKPVYRNTYESSAC